MVTENIGFWVSPANVCSDTLLENLSAGQCVSDVTRGRFGRGDFVVRDKVFTPAAQ
jgi:hypothetical protein